MSKPALIGLLILFAAIIAGIIVFFAWRSPVFQLPGDTTPPSSFPPGEFGAPPPEEASTPPSLRDLIQLTDGSVSGFHPTQNGVFYIERATGHIFEITPQGDSETKISNTTIPQIFNVAWSPNNDGAIFHYREGETIRIASTEFKDLSAKGVLLPQGTIAFDYAPERSRIFYLVEGIDELVGIAADPDNTAQAEIMRLPDADFLVDWITPKEIAFLSRPSGEALGFLYRYNINRISFDKILGNIRGLDAKWSLDGSRILFSQYNTDTKKSLLFIYSMKTGAATSLNTQGFVQKCAWSKTNKLYCASPVSLPDALYPDAWLKGQIQTSDRIIRIDIEMLSSQNIKTLPNLDVGDIMLSPEEDFLYFQNKKDGMLWSLRLK
ncbi:MAG: hypothetical protein HY445_03565 [Candidatus Niyogibacteria bacterium]|nr:hypothetical protein [Candidatus Niyogibacteria bacterium]